MLYQKFEHLTVISGETERQAYIIEDPSCKVLSPEFRQLVLDLADHSPFITCPFKATQEQKIEYRQLTDICQELRAKIIAINGPGKIVVPVSRDFAYFLHIHLNSDNDDTGYYDQYPGQEELIMEPGEFISLVQYPTSTKDRKVNDRILKLKDDLRQFGELLDISSGLDRIKYDTARTMANAEIKFLEELLTFSA